MLQCMLGASVFLLVCLLELNLPPPDINTLTAWSSSRIIPARVEDLLVLISDLSGLRDTLE